MKIVIKYPVTVRVDNVCAIFMVSNITATCHTKQMDIRYKYVNKYVNDGVVKIDDILTKNLSAELHKKHSRKMVGDKP